MISLPSKIIPLPAVPPPPSKFLALKHKSIYLICSLMLTTSLDCVCRQYVHRKFDCNVRQRIYLCQWSEGQRDHRFIENRCDLGSITVTGTTTIYLHLFITLKGILETMQKLLNYYAVVNFFCTICKVAVINRSEILLITND